MDACQHDFTIAASDKLFDLGNGILLLSGLQLASRIGMMQKVQ